MFGKKKEIINPILLDSDTYQHILNRNVETINVLKEKQANSLTIIEDNKSTLTDLKLEKRELNKRIKFTKRILKDEKRKLKKTNKKLKIKRDYIVELSNAYIDENENYVDSKSFTLQYTNTKKR